MISNLFAAPFVFCALILLYVSWKFDSDFAPWVVPPVIAAALVYIFSPQINWWWYSRRPPAMSQELQVLLNRFSAYYQQLDEADKKKFRDRLMLFVMGTDWMPLGWPDDEMPPDVKYVLALHAVMLTFNRPKFLFEKFEKVVVYPRPFLHPVLPMRMPPKLTWRMVA
ncbi:MAG: zinc-dependent peptidase [Saprospiraceae bacterium]